MEGWIEVKTSSGIIASTYTPYYGILDNQQIMYYEGLTQDTKKPFGIAGSINVQGGKVTKSGSKYRADKKGLYITVTDRKKNVLKFDCLNPTPWNTWYNAIDRAVSLHELASKKHALYNEQRQLLGFDPVDEHATDEEKGLSKAKITKAYKTLAIKAHPDRGGDSGIFHKICSAYTALITLQNLQDEIANSTEVQYEAVIEKTEKGGVGISVSLDEVKDLVLITTVSKDVLVKALTEEADGAIHPGDRIIAIDDEECSDWRVTRLSARLGAARVPVGSTVHLTISRRKPLDEQHEFTPLTSPSVSAPSSPTRDPWDNSYQNTDYDTGVRVGTPETKTDAVNNYTEPDDKPLKMRRDAPSMEMKSGPATKDLQTSGQSSRRLSVGVAPAPVDSLIFQSDRINELCHQKAELHGELAQLESTQMQLQDRIARLMQMLEDRRRSVTGEASLQDELELTSHELEQTHESLLLKRAECRQLASHVAALRHALNRPLVDAVEHLRRAAHLSQVKDEYSLTSTYTRALAYQGARESAKKVVQTLLGLLD